MTSFSDLGLPQGILKSLDDKKYIKPYPIQEQAIPVILKRKDVLGIAQTGSGKTAGYALPVLTNLLKSKPGKDRHPKVLILVPTRELAVQVEKVFREFSENLTQLVKSMAVYGGVSINPQMKALFGIHVLIATPGRLLELSESKAVHLSEVETLVLDEADKMLNMGFQAEMDKIFNLLPRRRQNLLFSATLSKEVENINRILLNNPVTIRIEPEKENLDIINQMAYTIEEDKKGPLLRYLLQTKKMRQVLVFTSSVYKADHVADKLRKNGIDASATHSKKSQKARTTALDNFKNERLRVLVATDLLSRGIDIEFLPVVINYELPRSPKDYIHRIGRTGRAENPGEAISLISAEEEHHFKVIQKKIKKQIPTENGNEIDLKGF